MTRAPTKKKEKPPLLAAASISVSCCDMGHVFVRLHNEEGDVFAVAPLIRGVALQFIDRVLDAVDGKDAAPCKE